MKNILIIIGMVVVMGVVGFIGTAETTRQMGYGLAPRQTYQMIGGGVGMAVGALLGFWIVVALDRRK